MALCIPVKQWAEIHEKSELEKMEEIQEKLESVFSNLTDVMTQVDKIVGDLISKEEQRKIWSDFGEGVADDPEDDVDPEYDPDDMYKFDFGDIDRIFAEMQKEEVEDEEDGEDDEDDEAARAAWRVWDKFDEE